DAVELLLPDALDIACRHLGITPPLPPRSAGAFVMIDCAAHRDPTDELASLLSAHDGVLAVGAQRDTLYAIRDHITIALGALGVPLKLDVAVPVLELDRLVRRISSLLAEVAPSSRLVVFGHLAEGNLHVNVLGLDDQARDVVRTTVLETTISLGGTISAEHGIGVAKVDWMERLHGSAHVAVLRAVKDALDPAGMLNPGVLLPRRAALA
ncbi:MAG: FAD-binding oxidoreductase, partial [Ilumatobacteraceae bacterium]